MRIAVLTHAEAADSAVFANLAKHLLGGTDQIAYVDRPDVGGQVDIPLPLAQPVATPSPAALAFGGQPTPPVPAAPSTPTAATAPTAAPSATPAGVVVDKAGLPWDARIHASSKVFVADGTWRQKRGTPPELLAQVEAELRQTMGLPAPQPVPQPPAPPAPPAANSVFGAAALAAGLPQPVLVPPAPPVPETPAAPPHSTLLAAAQGVAAGVIAPPGSATSGDPATFAEMMLWLTPNMPHKISTETLNATLTANGLPSLNALISRPDLVPVLVQQFKAMLA